MEFSFTESGARKLIKNGYQYVKQKDLANGLTSWECIESGKGSCKEKVRLNVIDDFLKKVRTSSKRKASTTHGTTQQILGTELAN